MPPAHGPIRSHGGPNLAYEAVLPALYAMEQLIALIYAPYWQETLAASTNQLTKGSSRPVFAPSLESTGASSFPLVLSFLGIGLRGFALALPLPPGNHS